MPLTPNDPRVKKSSEKLLTAAKTEDSRHQLHAEPATDAASASPYWKKVVDKELTCVIPAKTKRKQILSKVAWPLVSVELVDEIQDACGAVHTAQDRLVKIELSDEKLQADYEQYLETIGIDAFIKSDCANALFASPCSLVIVDLPAEQTTPFPEPVPYLLPVNKVIAIEINTTTQARGMVEFVYFDTDLKDESGNPLRALFDSEAFSLYQRGKDGQYTLYRQTPHSLGYCPAFKMWADLDSQNPLISNTILRPLLGKLDRYPVADASKEMFDTIGANPIFWHLKADDSCSYQTADGHKCQGGVVEYREGDLFELKREACPLRDKCQEKSLIGPGSKIPIPAQQSKDDADWRVPAGWIEVAVEGLNYQRDKLAAMRSEIKATATGLETDLMRNESLNTDQVTATLEKGRKVLAYMAQYYEILHRRLLDTIGRLRYDAYYLGCEVSYGRRFTMLSGDQLMQLKQQAVAAKAPDWQMEEIDELLQDYHARGDASRGLRFRLLTDLNPYPYRSPGDLQAAGINQSDPEGFTLSVGLMGLVKRFERENAGLPVERFGIMIPYHQRVSEILKSLYEYVREKTVRQPGQEAGIQPVGTAAV